MRKIINLMTNMYKIKELRIDFMGYYFSNENELSYHHLILSKKKGGKETIENGAILVRNTSHDYIHIIEKTDRSLFEKITNEIIDEKNKGRIDMDNINRIHELLLSFEERYEDECQKDGTLLVKDRYKERILLL